MLTGRNAFAGESVMQVAYAILHANPPPPSTLVQGLSPRFDEVVLRALQKKAADRHASAHAFAEAVRRAAAAPGATWLSRLASVWRRTTSPAALDEPTTTRERPAPALDAANAMNETLVRPLPADAKTPSATSPQPASAPLVTAIAGQAPASADSTWCSPRDSFRALAHERPPRSWW